MISPFLRIVRPLAWFLLPLAMGAWACGSDSDGSGTSGNKALFHADLSAIPGFNKDTGLQPSGSPVQLQLKVSASGNGAIDASAAASGSSDEPVLTAVPGSGKVSIAGGFGLEGRLVVDISGLPGYDGPVPGLDNVKIDFTGDESFDPYLLGGTATAKAPIPATDLPAIPLPGGLPGSLIIKIGEGSTVNLEFSGVCAAIEGDQAQYTGTVTRSGSLILQPRVEIEVPIVGKKTFDIPEVTAPISTPAEAVDLGTHTVGFGAAPADGTETAKVGTCGTSSDGGPGDDGSGQGGSGQGGNPGVGGSAGDAGPSCEGLACASSDECCQNAPVCTNGKCSKDPCTSCAQGACASQMTVCSDSDECTKLWTCWNACTGTDAEVYGCSQGCLLSHPSAQDAWFRLQGCFFAKCHDSCGGSSCGFGVGEATCDNCLKTTCGAECAAATDSQDCMSYLFCGSYCSTITCAVDCNNYPVAGCLPVENCLGTKCASQCGYDPDASL